MLPNFSRATRDNVTFVATVANVVASLLVAFFAYLVSSDVRDIQKLADERARAKELQEFWAEMHGVARKADEQSGKFGEALMKFVMASGQVLEEYARIHRNGSFDSMSYDPKYQAAYASYLGAYGEASAAISSVGREFIFLRIRYSPLAATNKVDGWALFANQDPDVNKWTNGAQANVDRITALINDTLTNRKDPNAAAVQLAASSSQLGTYLVKEPIPYAIGLARFLDANWKTEADTVKVKVQ